MEWKDLIMAALTIGVPAIATWVQSQGKKREALRDEFQEFRLQVAEKYVKVAQLDKIEETLARIEGLLHTKADKRPAYREGN